MLQPFSPNHQQYLESLTRSLMAHRLNTERLLSKTTTKKHPPELPLHRFLYRYLSGQSTASDDKALQKRLGNNLNRWRAFKEMANQYQRVIAEYPRSKAADSRRNTIPRHTLKDGSELFGEKSTNGEHFIIVNIRRRLEADSVQLVVEPADHGESHAHHYLLRSVGIGAAEDGSTMIQFITTEDTPLFRLLMNDETTAYLLS